MTTSVRPATRTTHKQRIPMDPDRRTAFLAGALFLVTYLASIPPKLTLYPPMLQHADYIVGPGADARVLWGAFLEVILIVANIGTAVALFGVLKRQNERLALAFVAARIMESVFIAVGILSVLSVVTLRQDFSGVAGADSGTLVAVGKALVVLHDWTFLLGPGFVVGIGNGMILGYLLYRSHLVPRGMAVLGLVGGPLLCFSGAAVIFGIIELDSEPQLLAAVPEFFWELSLGIYLMVKGFRPAPASLGTVQP